MICAAASSAKASTVWVAPSFIAKARFSGIGSAAIAGLSLFAVLELRTAQPLLRVQRLTDRAIGGGWNMNLSVVDRFDNAIGAGGRKNNVTFLIGASTNFGK